MSRQILSLVAEVPVALLDSSAVQLGLKEDLFNQLQKVYGFREEEKDEEQQPAKKARRNLESLQEQLVSKTQQCLWILENRMDFPEPLRP